MCWRAIEAADLVIDAGGVNFNEINLRAAYTSEPETFAWRSSALQSTTSTTSGLATESSTLCRWAISLKCWSSRCPRKLQDTLHHADRPARETQAASRKNDPITAATLVLPCYRDFFKPKDLIVLESGSSNSGTFPLPPSRRRRCRLHRCGSLDRLGHRGGSLDRGSPIHRDEPSSSQGRFAPVDRHRRRDHGTLRSSSQSFLSSTTRGYMVRAGRSRQIRLLGLQRPRPLELSCSSRRPGLARSWFTAKVSTLTVNSMPRLDRAATG